MTTKYVSVTRGDDTTGDGSAATPWKTIDKAIGSGYGSWRDDAAANTLYVEPGVYREKVTLGISPTSTGPLTIRGDYDGSGFAAGGYASAASGLVEWRAWSNDATELTGPCLTASSKNYVAVEHVKFIGGKTGAGTCADVTSGTNWTFTACAFVSGYTSGGLAVQLAPTAAQTLTTLFDRCVFYAIVVTAPALRINSPMNATEWDLGVTVRNCQFAGAGTGVQAYAPTGGGVSGGGLVVQNCTFLGVSKAVDFYYTRSATISTYPCLVKGCSLLGTGLNAGTTAALTSDGNVVLALTQYTNVTGGANDKTLLCPAVDVGDWVVLGSDPRPFGEPSASSPFNAFGNFGTTPTVDLSGQARPATASAGALEHDAFSGGGGGGGGTADILNLGASMAYKGDFGVGQTVTLPFWTTATLADGAASVLRDDGVKSTSGVAIDLDRDSTTGRNAVTVDTSAGSGFYADNHDYEVSLTAGTVGGDSAAGLLGSFSIRNRPIPVKSTAFDTSGIKSVGG